MTLPAAFLVVADEQFGRQIPFAFLEKVKEEWQSKWAEKGPAATAHSLDKSFGPRLKHWMEYCEQHPEELSKVASVQKKVRVGPLFRVFFTVCPTRGRRKRWLAQRRLPLLHLV